MTSQEAALVGLWKSDPSDPSGSGIYGDVTLKFGTDGTLLYTIHELDRDQVMRLTYRTEPGIIVTDQPSQPRPEKTEYEFSKDGALILAFGGQKTRYVKIK